MKTHQNGELWLPKEKGIHLKNIYIYIKLKKVGEICYYVRSKTNVLCAVFIQASIIFIHTRSINVCIKGEFF